MQRFSMTALTTALTIAILSVASQTAFSQILGESSLEPVWGQETVPTQTQLKTGYEVWVYNAEFKKYVISSVWFDPQDAVNAQNALKRQGLFTQGVTNFGSYVDGEVRAFWQATFYVNGNIYATVDLMVSSSAQLGTRTMTNDQGRINYLRRLAILDLNNRSKTNAKGSVS